MGEVIHGDYSRFIGPQMLHSVTNYEMHKSIYSAHNDHNYFELAHNVRRLEAVGRQLYTFVDNHDENRIASKLNNNSILQEEGALLHTNDAKKNLKLYHLIRRLTAIHRDEPLLHGGLYRELFLTNRQYAFARTDGHSAVLTAASNDDAPALCSVPLPFHTDETELCDLLTGRPFPVQNNQVQIELEGNSAVILKITEG